MWNIDAPQCRTPCAILIKFAEFVQDALTVKTSMDLLKGLRNYAGFKLTGSGYPEISSAP